MMKNLLQLLLAAIAIAGCSSEFDGNPAQPRDQIFSNWLQTYQHSGNSNIQNAISETLRFEQWKQDIANDQRIEIQSEAMRQGGAMLDSAYLTEDQQMIEELLFRHSELFFCPIDRGKRKQLDKAYSRITEHVLRLRAATRTGMKELLELVDMGGRLGRSAEYAELVSDLNASTLY